MSLYELTIPDWAFLDGYSHEGNALEDREVLIHTPTLTIAEIIYVDKVEPYINKNIDHRSFSHNKENFIIAVYKSLADDIEDILDQAIEWYKKEVDFMNKQILMDN